MDILIKHFSGGQLNVTVQVLDAYKNIRKIVFNGSYHGITSTVEVTLSPSKFSKFAYYSVSEGGTIWWKASDTVWGPIPYTRLSKSCISSVLFMVKHQV